MANMITKLIAARPGEGRTKKAMHPMLLLVIVVMLCAIASYIIPAGTYGRVQDSEIGQEIIDPESFTYIERTPTSVLGLLEAMTLGLQNGAYVIAFLLIIGGMFGVIGGTGALNVGIAHLIKLIGGKEFLMIPVFMIIFGCGSAFCGNFEEFLVFVPLILACCITVGYDSLTAVGIIFVAAAAGYGGAITNAFTVGTAQEIAGLPMFSGMGLRVALFIVLELASIIYVIWYAGFVKKNPKLSGAYEYDKEFNQDKKLKLENIPDFTKRQKAVIVVFLAGILVSVWGIIVKGYYVDELSGIFLATAILGGAVGGLRPSEICLKFEKGCHDMLLPGLMIGLANSAVLLLENANVMDTVLHAMAGVLGSLPSSLMAVGMFIFHELFNVAVPSGSAQARITMPLMVPLADMSGITRQTAVLAYQLGDAFTNVLAPTGGEILAALAICKVPFGKWIRFLLPVFIIWCVISVGILVFASQTGYGPF